VDGNGGLDEPIRPTPHDVGRSLMLPGPAASSRPCGGPRRVPATRSPSGYSAGTWQFVDPGRRRPGGVQASRPPVQGERWSSGRPHDQVVRQRRTLAAGSQHATVPAVPGLSFLNLMQERLPMYRTSFMQVSGRRVGACGPVCDEESEPSRWARPGGRSRLGPTRGSSLRWTAHAHGSASSSRSGST